MKILRFLCYLALGSVTLWNQNIPRTVKLTVEYNGRLLVGPSMVTLTFEHHSLQVPIQNGVFRVPAAAIAAKKVSISLEIMDEYIRVPDLNGEKLTQENWTLFLADKDFGDGYEYVVPEGADVRSACILSFDSIHSDPGTAVFVEGCRHKVARRNGR